MLLDFQDFRPRDLNGFASIVGRVFHDDAYTNNPFLNNCVMRYELLGYLIKQNYAKTVFARPNQNAPREPVGIFIANIGGARIVPWAFAWLCLYTVPLLLSRPGRRYLAYMRGLRNTDLRLLAGTHYDAELRLFVVRPEYQNEGIGKALLSSFQRVCNERGIKEYFLFTDSYCNVNYYLERGFLLKARQTYNFFHESPPTQYYLFTNGIPATPPKSPAEPAST